MSIAPADSRSAEASDVSTGNGVMDDAPVKRRLRKSTSHLKEVPQTLEMREQIKVEAEKFADTLDRGRSFMKPQLEEWSRQLLGELDLPEKYVGFVAVLIGNFFWKRQFLSIPFERRLLLLPHCLKHAEGCPADYDEFGLDCETCGACSIADYKVTAEKLGYKVLVAEGSPIVLKIIVSGYIDGILGVACLNVLEKAIDKVLIAGVPSYAIPLHSGDCKNTTLDQSWVFEVLDRYEPLTEKETPSYLPLIRASNFLFEKDFDRLLPRVRTKDPKKADSPIAFTEKVAYDWLQHGGKRFRPFITLAAYDAMTGGKMQMLDLEQVDRLPVPDSVCRVAMSIEAFHKASLVHDDIEDDDLFRYGRETLHRTHGLGSAINVGDHLIGLGYQLLNSCRQDFDAETACDVSERMAQAHIKLCDGQGAEMAWETRPTLDLTPIDALQIYALKTSPAFEAALYSGLRMAGPLGEYEEMVPKFSRHLGVGFQVLNDLKDWRGDRNNKLLSGQDAQALRPTVMLALAIEAASNAQRKELQEILDLSPTDEFRAPRLRRLYEQLGVFDKAEALVDKSRARAEALADDVENDQLRQLLYFLVDTVLAPEADAPPEQIVDVLVELPIAETANR
ncbi:MAG: polyprenyl synthetase family protein [Planctomycetota bacterium]|nr:polyprenyl synthetase family protein [Planctomycetota bacterium]